MTFQSSLSGFVVLALAVTGIACSPAPDQAQKGHPTRANPHGAYLGQPLPGDTPQVFGPGFVSTGLYERDLTMTPDGKEIYFGIVLGNYGRTAIMVTRQADDGSWSTPEVASFSGTYKDSEASVSPDGQRLFFASNRPHTPGGEPLAAADIWVAERVGDGWSEATPLGAPVNTEGPEFFPSLTNDGTLYFTRDFERGVSAIFRARPVEGGFAEPERLGEAVNSVGAQFNSYVAPDESYLLYGAYGREDSLGATDYYVSFRDADDNWVGPIHLGDKVNSASGLEYSPYVSPDGKAFFFMTATAQLGDEGFTVPRTAADLAAYHAAPQNGLPDIWWVDAAFIQTLRP